MPMESPGQCDRRNCILDSAARQEDSTAPAIAAVLSGIVRLGKRSSRVWRNPGVLALRVVSRSAGDLAPSISAWRFAHGYGGGRLGGLRPRLGEGLPVLSSGAEVGDAGCGGLSDQGQPDRRQFMRRGTGCRWGRVSVRAQRDPRVASGDQGKSDSSIAIRIPGWVRGRRAAGRGDLTILAEDPGAWGAAGMKVAACVRWRRTVGCFQRGAMNWRVGKALIG